MLGISALHLQTFSNYDFPKSKYVPELYLDKAISEHRLAVAQPQRSRENAEAIVGSGLLIMYYRWCYYNHHDRTNEVFKLPLQIWYLARSLDTLFNTLSPLLSDTTRQLLLNPIPPVAAGSIFEGNPFLASGRADLAYFFNYVEADSIVPKADLQVYEHCVDTLLNLYAVMTSPRRAQQHIPYEMIFLTPIWEAPRFLELLGQGVAPALALLARTWCLLKFVGECGGAVRFLLTTWQNATCKAFMPCCPWNGHGPWTGHCECCMVSCGLTKALDRRTPNEGRFIVFGQRRYGLTNDRNLENKNRAKLSETFCGMICEEVENFPQAATQFTRRFCGIHSQPD